MVESGVRQTICQAIYILLQTETTPQLITQTFYRLDATPNQPCQYIEGKQLMQ